ncbi:class I SAM-dependent methyltransferase [Silvibacterium sp.]|uniref:class I SAM-dependent methyltransferase n=1 Tax=Silvibacterium sp. TaxID=1964179 RepID=UPI0039E42BAA
MTPAFETFRDPAGSLRIENDRVLRRVHAEYASEAVALLQSKLIQEWVSKGHFIATKISEQADESGDLLLEHPRVFFPSYPWEWTPGAWVAAAELTLDLSDALLDQGLALKDATPLNVLFEGARAVFVDVLSIEKRDTESPLWLPYGQFIRTFLLPLAAYRYLGWPLAASLQKRDGYEPADLYPWLSRTQRWSSPLRSLVMLPYLLEKRSGGKPAAKPRLRQSPEIAAAVLKRNLRGLRNALHKLAPDHRSSRWSNYPDAAGHYSDTDHAQKQEFVRNALAGIKPAKVLDLGANTGVYSRIAAAQGASVVGWDTDIGATERNWNQAQSGRLDILPLIADPARPTPAAGWRNAETLSLLARAQGRFDCVMALGLIHHLLLSEQIPLPDVASLLRDLTTRWAIVEWIPAADPRFADLVRGRDELYAHLDEEAFIKAIDAHFDREQRLQLPNGRSLFLLKAR